jgi:hypothetical protein
MILSTAQICSHQNLINCLLLIRNACVSYWEPWLRTEKLSDNLTSCREKSSGLGWCRLGRHHLVAKYSRQSRPNWVHLAGRHYHMPKWRGDTTSCKTAWDGKAHNNDPAFKSANWSSTWKDYRKCPAIAQGVSFRTPKPRVRVICCEVSGRRTRGRLIHEGRRIIFASKRV